MYSLTRLVSLRHLLLQQLPTLSLSLVIAEVFYKFHSFTLECLAFLATWYAIDLLFQLGKQLIWSRVPLKSYGDAEH
jgi:hypothetical protein